MQNPVNRAPCSYHGEYSPVVTMVNTKSPIKGIVTGVYGGMGGSRPGETRVVRERLRRGVNKGGTARLMQFAMVNIALYSPW